MWVWQATLSLVAPFSLVLVYGMITPSQTDDQVAYRVLPGVSSPEVTVWMNAEPGSISTHEGLTVQAEANVVPWLAPAIEARCRTYGWPPSSWMYQSLTSPPMEWLTMSTCEAPVRARTCWM